jgi:hypothetical protein
MPPEATGHGASIPLIPQSMAVVTLSYVRLNYVDTGSHPLWQLWGLPPYFCRGPLCGDHDKFAAAFAKGEPIIDDVGLDVGVKPRRVARHPRCTTTPATCPSSRAAKQSSERSSTSNPRPRFRHRGRSESLSDQERRDYAPQSPRISGGICRQCLHLVHRTNCFAGHRQGLAPRLQAIVVGQCSECVTFATKGGLFSIVPELHPSTMTVKYLIYCSFRGGSYDPNDRATALPDSVQPSHQGEKLLYFKSLATPAGIEPATFSLEGCCSIR